MTNQPDRTRFRRLPLEVEARQVVGSDDGQTGRDLAAWCGGWVSGTHDEPKIGVPTLEGDLVARVGDWIVRGTQDEFWPVKGDIFAGTYEPVRPAPSMSVAEAEARLAPLEDAVRADRHAQQDAETEEQRADREETERDHARGDHTHCGITCEVELPTEHLRNFVIAKGYPGTKGALDELLRRAAAVPVAGAGQATDQTALRDRIAGAIWERQNPGRRWEDCEYRWRADAEEDAEAVLAVLPAPTDTDAVRAATLHEAADRLPQMRIGAEDPNPDDHVRGYNDGLDHAEAELRRLADEQPAQHRPPRHRWAAEFRDPVANEWIPGTRFLNRHHAVERYEAAIAKAPAWKDGTPVERRIVRETTTYTVEAEHPTPDGS